MVEILRNKWCEDLEDMLQCPICMMCRPNTYIYQCTEGHHICYGCKSQVGLKCPTCGKDWTIYRNRLAENMCSKFEDIKDSLIDPEAEINKLLIPDTFCVGTQTDSVQNDAIESINAIAEISAVSTLLPPTEIADSHSGAYPCCLGTCGAKMSFEPLMKHLKSMHSPHFIEFGLPDDLLFEHKWEFSHTCSNVLEYVFRIHGVGVFVLKLSTDKCGDFCGYIMMIHSGFYSKLFSYRLKLTGSSGQNLATFTGQVNSCRSPTAVFENQCLRVKNDDIVKVTSGESSTITCTLLLARKLKLDDVVPPKANVQNKKRLRNRNKATKTQATNN